ncbi:MAG: hypothetical protein HRU07_07820 [Nitrosopumilus sp.]|nr:hypothetical protein [Nitrosopumilus sp.]NRA06045.1 hypothetical protein [Nitrosopumilus sp.]
MVLNDLELCIVSAKSMRLSESESMQYLKDNGHEIDRATYYRRLGHISAESKERAFEIAKNFLEDHISTIDELQSIKKMMYQNYILEDDKFKKTMILVKITELFPFISAYREATKHIIEGVKKKVKSQDNLGLFF